MKYDYKKLTPFKMQCLTNFPFIDEDFDALSNYGLLCKIVEYLNKISTNDNMLIDNINELNNWFNNLDVTDEINNKLDALVEDGTIARIINQDLFNEINTTLSQVSESVELLTNKKIIIIGDSYSSQQFEDITKFWYRYFAENLGLTLNENLFVKGTPGAGFGNEVFTSDLSYVINTLSAQQRDEITDIFVVGGWNDRFLTDEELQTKMLLFKQLANTNLKNAQITIAYVGNSNPRILQDVSNRHTNFKSYIRYNTIATKLNIKSLKNSCYILHNYNSTYWEVDGVHPSQLGQEELGNQLTQGFINGICDVVHLNFDEFVTATPSGICNTISNNLFISGINNNLCFINKQESHLYFGLNEEIIFCDNSHTYELASIDSGYFSGTGILSGTSVPIVVLKKSSTKPFNGYATVYFEYGKLKIKMGAFNEDGSPINEVLAYIFIPDFDIKCESHLA